MRKMKGGRISLACTLRKADGNCPGRASCNEDGTNARVTTLHTHAGNPTFKKKRELRKSILDRCRTNDPSSFRDIVEQEGDGYSRRVKMSNNHNSLRSAMRRARLEKFPKIPGSLSALGEALRKRKNRHITRSKDGKDNLFFGAVGSSRRETRSIIFMSRRQLACLRKAKKLFADGTWDARPSTPKSRQVFSISTCTKNRRVLPLAVVLMQSRSNAAYDKLFTVLRDNGCNPRVVHTDFEIAQYSSWKRVFGRQLRVEGCLYHYVVRLRKRAKKLRLSALLKRNAVANSIVRSCNALPLLPHYRFEEGLATIKRRARRAGLQIQLAQFFQYMEYTWAPRRKIVSVYHSTDRTNNVAESWNKTLTMTVKQKSPNVWLFIDALVKLEERYAQDIFNVRHGRPANRLRKSSAVRNDQVIRELTGSLNADDISISQFLRQASYRMQNVWNPV
ncbi:NAD(P)H-quinone oxidoreductase subunit J, chloroplastic [Frankliniella fusca]|uniref:NAD(P)H-quinone oxidoreductase subunit J, chloroplastic n=1 Tax=Frankliniella fusca TaxID=407009 RepID=A0AAE1GR96_9NEOP|nr:NAD(P)H-quinone oxidoreductase subunit J, chloroplastic [Frankliniella fusca]